MTVMASARRREQARRRIEPAPRAGGGVPAELLDPEADVWHNQTRYVGYMRAREWSLPPSERFGVPTHPENRRSSAAEGWAVENGVTETWGRGHADWHRMREMGLVR